MGAKRSGLHPLLFVIPIIALMLFIGFGPLLISIYYSTTNFNPARSDTIRIIGVDNYLRMIEDPTLHRSILNTLLYVGVVVPVDLILGFILALMVLNKTDRLIRVYRIGMIIPTMMAPVAGAFTIRYLFFPVFGLVDSSLRNFGLEPIKLTTTSATSLFSIMLTDFWQFTPFSFFILLSGLMAIPPSMRESADVDGANYFQKLRHIMLPMLKGLMLVVVLLRMTDAFKIFEYPFLITYGGPGNSSSTIAYYLFKIGLGQSFEIGYASAISWIINIIVMSIALILIRSLARMTR